MKQPKREILRHYELTWNSKKVIRLGFLGKTHKGKKWNLTLEEYLAVKESEQYKNMKDPNEAKKLPPVPSYAKLKQNAGKPRPVGELPTKWSGINWGKEGLEKELANMPIVDLQRLSRDLVKMNYHQCAINTAQTTADMAHNIMESAGASFIKEIESRNNRLTAQKAKREADAATAKANATGNATPPSKKAGRKAPAKKAGRKAPAKKAQPQTQPPETDITDDTEASKNPS